MARSSTPKAEKVDRAEVARQRLAAKTGGRRLGPVVALPSPKTVFAKKTLSWILWLVMALNLVAWRKASGDEI